MIDTITTPDKICSLCEDRLGVIYGPDPYIAGLYNLPGGSHPLLGVLYADYPVNAWWCLNCYDRLCSRLLSDIVQLGDVMVSNLDASKPVTPEGLVMLGWSQGPLNSYHYKKDCHKFRVWPGDSGSAYSRFDRGDWNFDRHSLRGKLAPRTLAEVKWLMDRIMEDA